MKRVRVVVALAGALTLTPIPATAATPAFSLSGGVSAPIHSMADAVRETVYVDSGLDLDGDGTSIEDRPEGLALNQGGNASEENLAIVNAFRQSRNLPTVTLDQLGTKYGYVNVDVRLTKIFKFGTSSIEAMAEVFNLFNRTNFNAPNGTLTSATFLQVSSAADSREAQFGIRFRF